VIGNSFTVGVKRSARRATPNRRARGVRRNQRLCSPLPVLHSPASARTRCFSGGESDQPPCFRSARNDGVSVRPIEQPVLLGLCRRASSPDNRIAWSISPARGVARSAPDIPAVDSTSPRTAVQCAAACSSSAKSHGGRSRLGPSVADHLPERGTRRAQEVLIGPSPSLDHIIPTACATRRTPHLVQHAQIVGATRRHSPAISAKSEIRSIAARSRPRRDALCVSHDTAGHAPDRSTGRVGQQIQLSAGFNKVARQLR